MRDEHVALGELLTTIRNGLNTTQYDDRTDSDMLPISRIETISAGTVDFTGVKYAKITPVQEAKYALRSGDILFSHINSPEHIGKTAIFRSKRTLIHGVNLLVLRPDIRKCHPEYLNYYLMSFEARALFRTRCKKAVNQASLNQEDVSSLPVPLPPLPVQKRIASILEKADRLRQLRRYALGLSDTYLQSIFLEVFGDPVTNPKGWPHTKMDEIVKIISGKNFKHDEYSNDGVRLFQIANVTFQQTNWDTIAYLPTYYIDNNKGLVLNAGDLVMALNRPILGDKVKFAILSEEDCPAILYQRVGKLVIKSQRIVQPFLYGFMNTYYFHIELKRRLTGSDQPYINPTELVTMEVPVPPIEVQETFAQIVQKHERIHAQQREALRQAEHLFQTLLHRAFREELSLA